MSATGRRLPPLYALRAFEAAARYSSFKKASEELNITSAAVAHQVKKLESELGVKLFERHHKGVALNEAGQRYLRIVDKVLDELTRETQLFKSKHRAQPIRIGAMHIVSERLVRPMVQDFLCAHPNTRAELIADLIEPDFRFGNLDILIWHGTAPSDRFVSHELLSESLTPVCAPGLLARFPKGMEVSDLTAIPTVYDLYWRDDWKTWLAAAGGAELEYGLGFSLYSVMIQSLLEGTSIGIGHTAILERELRCGQLVKPFALEVESDKSYYALTTRELLTKSGVASFWAWMQAQTGGAGPDPITPKA